MTWTRSRSPSSALFKARRSNLSFGEQRSNGEIFPKDVRLFKGTYFGQDVIIAVAQDITERKHNEDDMQKQLKELTVLHAVALAESIAPSVDELLQQSYRYYWRHAVSGYLRSSFTERSTRHELKPHFSYRGTNEEDLSLYLPLTKGISGKVAATGSQSAQEMFRSNPHIMRQQTAFVPSFVSPSAMGQGLLAS